MSTTPEPDKRSAVFRTCLGIFLACLGIIVLSIIGLVMFGFSAFSSFESTSEIQETYLSGSGDAKIAVIEIHGVLGFPESEGGIAATGVEELLHRAQEDDAVKGVLLDIDSPGGTVVDSRKIYEAVLAIEKPTLAYYSGNTAASGAVYLSMGAESILSYPETITGSIGVIGQFYDLTGLMEKYGVKVNTIKSGKFKDSGSLTKVMTDEERQLFEVLLDESYQDFLKLIEASRGLTRDQLLPVADGRILSPSQSLAAGLIDGIGTQADANQAMLDLAQLDDAQFVRYEQPFSFDSLADLFVTKLLNQETLELLQLQRTLSTPKLLYLAGS